MGAFEWYEEAENRDFQKKIYVWLHKAAIAVLGEGTGTYNVKNHEKRVIYARKVLDGTAPILEACLACIASNATLQSKIDSSTNYDSDLEFIVNSVFSDLAGYDPDVDGTS